MLRATQLLRPSAAAISALHLGVKGKQQLRLSNVIVMEVGVKLE